MKTIPNDGKYTIYLVKLSLILLFIIIIEWWAGFYNIITTIDIIISLYPCPRQTALTATYHNWFISANYTELYSDIRLTLLRGPAHLNIAHCALWHSRCPTAGPMVVTWSVGGP